MTIQELEASIKAHVDCVLADVQATHLALSADVKMLQANFDAAVVRAVQNAKKRNVL